MKCCDKTMKVKDTRLRLGFELLGDQVKYRRHTCLVCGKNMTTYEITEETKRKIERTISDLEERNATISRLVSRESAVEPEIPKFFKDLNIDGTVLMKYEIAKAIADKIKVKRLTQKQAAEVGGISQPRVSALINGRISQFSLSSLISIASAIGVKVGINLQ